MKPTTTDMHPVLFDRFQLWKFRVNEQIGMQMVLTCIGRSKEEQVALYAQHRNPLAVVNEYRRLAGMPPIGEKDNSYEVTWTMNSKHFLQADGKSRAFDFALLVPGKKLITWDTKWDADHDGIPEYKECAIIAKECGLDAGGLWLNKPDPPHIQLPAYVT